MRIFLVLTVALTLLAGLLGTPAWTLTVLAEDGVSLEETGFEFPGNVPKLTTEEADDPVEVIERILLNFVVRPIFFLAAGVAIFILLQTSFDLVMARAEEDKLTAAKKTITWTLLGLVLIILAYTLARNLITFILSHF